MNCRPERLSRFPSIGADAAESIAGPLGAGDDQAPAIQVADRRFRPDVSELSLSRRSRLGPGQGRWLALS